MKNKKGLLIVSTLFLNILLSPVALAITTTDTEPETMNKEYLSNSNDSETDEPEVNNSESITEDKNDATINQGLITETVYDSDNIQVIQTYPAKAKTGSIISVDITVVHKQKKLVAYFADYMSMSTRLINGTKLISASDSNGKTYTDKSSVHQGNILQPSQSFDFPLLERGSIKDSTYKVTYNVQVGTKNITLESYVGYDDNLLGASTVGQLDHIDWNIDIEVEPIDLNINFNSNGGSLIEPQTVTSGDYVNIPTNPTKSGYTFKGWYTDADLTTAYDFSTPVTKDMTLYANWEKGSGRSQVDNNKTDTGSGKTISNQSTVLGKYLPKTGEVKSYLPTVSLILSMILISLIWMKKRLNFKENDL